MSYEIRFTELNKIPALELGGVKTIESLLQIWTNLRELVEERKLDRVLLLDEMTDAMTVWDVGDLETFLAETGFPRNVCVAIVDASRGCAQNSNVFSELYLQNRGWNQIRVFQSLESAYAWLSSSEADCCRWSPSGFSFGRQRG